MLVIDNANGGNYARSSILDSPTLARVERATLRHEGARRDAAYLFRNAQTQSLLPPSFTKTAEFDTIKRGLLWQQRDKIFSRWKERYFILTRDYLHCFKRAHGADKITDMGQFLFKIKLIEVVGVEWENKKTYSAVALVLFGREAKIFLRAPEGLEDWFEMLEECVHNCKEKRRAVTLCFDKKPRDNNNDRYLTDWLADRHRNLSSAFSTANDSASIRNEPVKMRGGNNWDNATLDNRLSLLTDIDIGTFDDSLETRSVTSYRMNQDVLCIQPRTLRHNDGTTQPHDSMKIASQLMKIRERSYSDIQRLDRPNRPFKYLD